MMKLGQGRLEAAKEDLIGDPGLPAANFQAIQRGIVQAASMEIVENQGEKRCAASINRTRSARRSPRLPSRQRGIVVQYGRLDE